MQQLIFYSKFFFHYTMKHRGKVNKLAKKLSGFLWTQNK